MSVVDAAHSHPAGAHGSIGDKVHVDIIAHSEPKLCGIGGREHYFGSGRQGGVFAFSRRRGHRSLDKVGTDETESSCGVGICLDHHSHKCTVGLDDTRDLDHAVAHGLR